MKVFARREAIVDDEDRAALEEPAERSHPGACEKREFAFIPARGRNFYFKILQMIANGSARRPVRPGKLSFVGAHPALHYSRGRPGERVNRHRVDHFIGEHHSAEALGQTVKPLHTTAELLLLAL